MQCNRDRGRSGHSLLSPTEHRPLCLPRRNTRGTVRDHAALADPFRRPACGRLEDTRRAKRLIADDGQEMSSAHISCFAYRDPASAVELAQAARAQAAGLEFPALFVAAPPADAEAIRRGLGSTEVVAAPATIYGTGLEAGRLWNINTAEI